MKLKLLSKFIFVIVVAFFAVFTFKINFSKSKSNVNYYECNKPSNVNTKKVLEKFGASDEAWKCFTDKISSCSPAIVYGQVSIKSKSIPIYFSIYGKNDDGDCIITGPFYNKEMASVKGNSCLVNDVFRDKYFGNKPRNYSYDYNYVVDSLFRGKGKSCTIQPLSMSTVPYCLLSEPNPDLKKCNLYFDVLRYNKHNFIIDPVIMSDNELLDMLAIEMMDSFGNFSSFKYRYEDYYKGVYEKSSIGSQIFHARLLTGKNNTPINNRKDAIDIIKKNGLISVSYIENHGEKPNIKENMMAYLEELGKYVSNEKKFEYLKNKGIAGTVTTKKYKTIYPFMMPALWLTEESDCYEDGVASVNGFVNENGDIIFLGYSCINSKNEVTKQRGYIWKKEMFIVKEQ